MESELVAGFFTEYSGLSFAFFFLSEYSSIILMSTLGALLFLGGYGDGFGFILGLKVAIPLYSFIWVRAALPRYRYFDLMQLCWKYLLPVVIGYFLFVGGTIIGFDLFYS